MKSIILIIAILLVGARGDSSDPCGPEKFPNVPTFLDGLDNCTYPANKFNLTCVKAAVSGLISAGMCPIKNGVLNFTAINQIFSIAQARLRQKTAICGTAIDPIPGPESGAYLLNILSPIPVTGICMNIPGMDSVTGVSQSTFTVSPPTSTQTVFAQTNSTGVQYQGAFNCNLTSAGVNQSNISPNVFIFNNIGMSLTGSASSVAQIDISGDVPTITITSALLTPDFNHQDFPFPPEMNILNIQDVFTKVIQSIIQQSQIAQSLATFLGTFLAYCLEVAKENC